MPTSFLFDGPEDARVTILLAHGAGAPMDSASMNATAKALPMEEVLSRSSHLPLGWYVTLSADAEDNRLLAQIGREPRGSHSDDDRVVTGEHQVDHDHADERGQFSVNGGFST